jgi:hypothetical protein
VRDNAHPQLPPSRQLLPSHERLRALACSFFSGKKELRACFASSSASEPSRSDSSSAKMCFQEPFVTREHEMCSPLVPRKGNPEYGTAGARLVLLHQLQVSLTWWKLPLNFAFKKVVRYIEHGVKVEFKKGLSFAPKPSAPKFVDPQDVDFAIQDLLKGRRIGEYQDLVPGGKQFLSRSRVHTPPGKGKQCIVHASAASTRQRSNVKRPTRIFACSSRSSSHKTSC